MNSTKSKPKTISLYEFMEEFPDEAAATRFFEQKRWQGNPYCPHCGSEDIAIIENGIPMPYRCRKCRKHFSVRTGTLLAESKLGLHKWLMAIYMFHTARKGISSVQLSKELGITQKSAWFLNHRIREAMMYRGGLFKGEVEVDETYIGGKEKNKHSNKKLHSGRGATGKQAVFGMVERNGATRAFPIDGTDRVKLQSAIVENIKRGSTLYTDSHSGYDEVKGYSRSSVAHSVGEYVREKVHTNGIESFWSLLKRGYIGIYHHMSVPHLHRYVNEFSFRHTLRYTDTMTCISSTVNSMIGKRLSYKELIS